MSIKILYVSHAAGHHGAVMSLYQMVKGLDRSRYAPLAAFSKDGTLADELRARGVPVFILKKRGFLSLGLIRESYDLVKREGAGIVHLNNAVPFCRDVAVGAKLAGARVFWHVREDPASKRFRKIRPWISLLAERVLVVSTEILRAFGGSEKVTKLDNCVDAGEFGPGVDGAAFRAAHGLGEKFVFGLVGTLEDRKGVFTLFEAASELITKGLDFRLLVVGSGLPEYEARVREFLDKAPELKATTVLTGRIKDVPRAMAAMDALVMPSTWEGFPRAVLEAMASGKPAIATPVGDVPYIIEDGVDGMLVPVGDARALADRMESCLRDPDGIKQMGGRAFRKYLDKYTLERHIERLQREYSQGER